MDRRRARANLWERGHLRWKLHSGQLKIDDAYQSAAGKIFVANCARRFGKTFWDCTKCCEVAIKTPNARIKYTTAFLSDLEEFAIPSFEKIMIDCPDALKPKPLMSKKKWIFGNGSEIKLIGLDRNPNGMRGNYADLVVFAEAALINRLDYLYSAVCLPMTQYRPNARIIMDSTPPETPDHAFRDFCERAEIANAYIKLTVHENPMLTPQEIAEIHAECLTETDWLREYMCEFVVDQTRAIVPEWQEQWVGEPERDPLFPYFRRYEAMDLGVSDQTVCLYGYYDFPRARLVIEDEVMMKGPEMTTDILAGKLKDMEVALWTGVDGNRMPIYRRTADNNNLLLLADLGRSHELHWLPTDKDELHTMVNKMRIWIKSGRVVISPRCKFLLGCLRNGIWDTRRKKFAQSTTYGHYDALAALMYMVRNIDEVDNPIPPNLGIDPAKYHIRLDSEQTKTQRELKKLLRPMNR